ncbi:unnamed protein product [Protopolystoma xenopodis]|uniref:Uncharacterized protein n=1 Tax=Protopolystoma xenopodis TaxID=117903 RepID=A0A448XHI2_9PLAT|nr:unnamed protein product [Protopolystoma xenopodis]
MAISQPIYPLRTDVFEVSGLSADGREHLCGYIDPAETAHLDRFILFCQPLGSNKISSAASSLSASQSSPNRLVGIRLRWTRPDSDWESGLQTAKMQITGGLVRLSDRWPPVSESRMGSFMRWRRPEQDFTSEPNEATTPPLTVNSGEAEHLEEDVREEAEEESGETIIENSVKVNSAQTDRKSDITRRTERGEGISGSQAEYEASGISLQRLIISRSTH